MRMDVPSNVVHLYESDLLESDAQVIAQQCNCTSKKAKGLAETIAKKYPYADFYSSRKEDSVPGTIKVVGNKSKSQRFVAAMFAQLNPGKPKKGDTASQREKWFEECLNKISKIKSLKSIAFPSGIGCGLAGGNWDTYYGLICDWARSHLDIAVHIISQDPEPESESKDVEEDDVPESPPVKKKSQVKKTTKKLSEKEIVDKSQKKSTKNVTDKISKLGVSQKMKLLDHLLEDDKTSVVLSSSKIIDDLVSLPDDETWIPSDKVVPSPPKAGEDHRVWKWIMSQGDYPQENEVEFYRFLWTTLADVKEYSKLLETLVNSYEAMSGRKCHLHDFFSCESAKTPKETPPSKKKNNEEVKPMKNVKEEPPKKKVEKAPKKVIEESEEESEEEGPEDGETEVVEDGDSTSEAENESEHDSEDDSEESEEKDSDEVTWSTTTLKDYTSSNIPEGWEEHFESQLDGGGLDDVSKFLAKEAKSHEIYPPIEEVYTAFSMCPAQNVRVVVIGQDPYHTKGAAMGIAFGHHADRGKLQPSLRNIYKCLKTDIPDVDIDETSGDLSLWCVQGVFLINTALTVREGEAGSHASKSKSTPGVWDHFIGQTLDYLNENCDHLVVIMWGSKAQEYRSHFDSKKHSFITAPHPAAGAYNAEKSAEFFEHKPFTKTNKFLKKYGMEEIDWSLPSSDDGDEDDDE
jgi:uracil-DNA glycosylase